MNEKQKVLEDLKRSKNQAEFVARQYFDIAMQNEEYKKLYLEWFALIAAYNYEYTYLPYAQQQKPRGIFVSRGNFYLDQH